MGLRGSNLYLYRHAGCFPSSAPLRLLQARHFLSFILVKLMHDLLFFHRDWWQLKREWYILKWLGDRSKGLIDLTLRMLIDSFIKTSQVQCPSPWFVCKSLSSWLIWVMLLLTLQQRWSHLDLQDNVYSPISLTF